MLLALMKHGDLADERNGIDGVTGDQTAVGLCRHGDRVAAWAE
jgi:hypothetical protein